MAGIRFYERRVMKKGPRARGSERGMADGIDAAPTAAGWGCMGRYGIIEMPFVVRHG